LRAASRRGAYDKGGKFLAGVPLGLGIGAGDEVPPPQEQSAPGEYNSGTNPNRDIGDRRVGDFFKKLTHPEHGQRPKPGP